MWVITNSVHAFKMWCLLRICYVKSKKSDYDKNDWGWHKIYETNDYQTILDGITLLWNCIGRWFKSNLSNNACDFFSTDIYYGVLINEILELFLLYLSLFLWKQGCLGAYTKKKWYVTTTLNINCGIKCTLLYIHNEMFCLHTCKLYDEKYYAVSAQLRMKFDTNRFSC